MATGLHGMEYQADVHPEGRIRWIMPFASCLKQRQTAISQ